MAAASSSPASSTSAAAAASSNSNSCSSAASSKWSSEQDKAFEKALVAWEDAESVAPSRWEEVASLVPGKTAAQVRAHYEVLLQDVTSIEAGLIAPPCYTPRDVLVAKESLTSDNSSSASKKPLACSSSSPGLYHHQQQQQQQQHHPHASSATSAALHTSNTSNGAPSSSKSKAQDQERRKGIPWTEDEHRLFLLGLEKFGKGDWRSISRNFVVSRTPTQVASHAQKYFIRLNSIHKDKRRTSIHDITSVNGDGRQQAQGPITGQASAAAAAAGGGAPAAAATTAAYSQPPAVGTPVPVHHGPYAVGAAQAHVSARPVPGTPLSVPHPHMAYPMRVVSHRSQGT